ncbi:g4520 [Coccomyxa viridis]|uniref:G4520 protein n=1 Tax=Coccomyxa viridis TaxID=1274662 RepID=A0ABP1FXG1_9CHLO
MGSVCINQCTNPRNPLFCTNCEDPADLCSKVVPSFNPATSTVHMGQGTNTDSKCPIESTYATGVEMQPIGQVAVRGNPFLNKEPNDCSSQSYQYDCVVGTSHAGQICVPLCPGPSEGPACLPCEDVRSNCEWAFPSFRMTSFITHYLMANTGACF